MATYTRRENIDGTIDVIKNYDDGGYRVVQPTYGKYLEVYPQNDAPLVAYDYGTAYFSRYWEDASGTKWVEIEDCHGIVLPALEPYSAPVPTLEEQRDVKIMAIEAKTKEIFAAGVPATVKGTEYRFDTRTGERAMDNWNNLSGVINTVANGLVPETKAFPRNVSAMKDAAILPLDTMNEAAAFWVELLTADASITAAGATLRKAVNDATTQEELDAIVDTR